MTTELHRATEKDCVEIARLARQIWMKHYITIISIDQIEYMLEKMYSARSLEEQLKKGHWFYFIQEEGKNKGYISVSHEQDGSWFLHKFYIDTGEQNKGMGSRAFALLLKELGNVKVMRLGVNRANFKSVNFYFKLGFKIEKLLNADIGNGYTMDDFIMKLSAEA